MNVLFVNPPCASKVSIDLAPPLWTLLLGSIAEECGCTSQILDLNLEVLSQRAPEDDQLYDWSIERVCDTRPDVVCFSSMGVNSHFCLKLAQRVKQHMPDVITILGGPHFSAIANDVIKRYPWIDFVATREAEVSFRFFLNEIKLRNGVCNRSIPGIVSREGPTLSCVEVDLRTKPANVPPPAYHLVELNRYFEVNPTRTLDFEAGQRGCVMSCRYCYAPGHFGQGERRQAPDVFVAELRKAVDLGARRFFFVQDNFINNPRATVDLCERIAAANLEISFHCYATLSQLSEPVVEAMAAAGCHSVYVGVDVVHPKAQRNFAKALYRGNEDMLRRFECCSKVGIRPTASFLLEEPDVGRDQLEDTIATALLAQNAGCRIRFNTLSLYPGTESYKAFGGRFFYDDLKVRLMMDLPSVVKENVYAQESPELFPFHSTHRPLLANSRFMLGVHALFTISKYYPNTLLELASDRRSWEIIEETMKSVDADAHACEPENIRRRTHLELFDTTMTNMAQKVGQSIERAYYQEKTVLILANDADFWENSACKPINSGCGSDQVFCPFYVSPTLKTGVVLLGILTDQGVTLNEIDVSLADFLRNIRAKTVTGEKVKASGRDLEILKHVGIVKERQR
ncbi:B12-binding domain-containing radical SAM protein [Gimesia maris]|uniref:B12 binding domain protein n=1 Tax=Gimesia maris TaxID=122 RepID=A0ABX5YIR1_9PLAN|nr:B12-binding domain-containing radical SAM protein [Gimesia maris]EDL57304.1 radical SAM domain/B12 binding domain protein [Gimesia maris DSM 8797]QEG15571.1 B12 binding domain protein [Gimesia maris]QGQ31133.1 B12-binding domain-containing radical SAM protein [Gimesia maris]